MIHSTGGAAGGGLGSLLLEKISEEFKDTLRTTVSVYPFSEGR